MPCSLDAATEKGFRTHFPYHTAYFERKQLKRKEVWLLKSIVLLNLFMRNDISRRQNRLRADPQRFRRFPWELAVCIRACKIILR